MTRPTDTDGRKVSSLRELPRSLEPPHDLWPRIEAQLGERRAALRPRWLAAAAMVACVAIGVWIGRSLLPGAPGTGTVAVVETAPPAGQVTPPAGQVYVSDPRYEQQRAALARDLQARLAALPAGTRTRVMASLRTIETAKSQLEQALGHDPSNALLQELLINTYQDEMRVLTDVHEASDPGRGI